MGLELRVPTDDDWADICHADGRAFAINYSPESRELARRLVDLSRFRIVTDGAEVVGVAGSYGLDVSMPGGTAVPMAGVTWVSVASTHRRRGILTMLLDAVHGDIDDRGEPVATLYASESAIYERFGYGIGIHLRTCVVDTRATSVQARFHPAPGDVRFVSGDDAEPPVERLWSRWWRTRAGEVERSDVHRGALFERRGNVEGTASAVHYLCHADGYAAYRVAGDWNDGFARHDVTLQEIVALTPEAHAALWHTLVEMDLVASITCRVLPADEALPYLLTNPRAMRTINMIDGVWVNVRDVSTAFGARSYATEDRVVVEVDGRRWAIEGGPTGAEVRSVRSRPDVVTDAATLGALLYGGVRPSTLAAGRRLTARDAASMRRADLFFPTAVAPMCQTMY